MQSPAADPATVHELFTHVRSVVGVIVGLAIGRLLQGVAGIMEYPRPHKVWWVHLGWVAWAVIFVISFWWWEFHLSKITNWTLGKYFFLFGYAGLYFLVCTVLFPTKLKEHIGYQEYLLSRRHWFFGLIALIAIFDLGDALIKGVDYLRLLGPWYFIHLAFILTVAAGGALARRPVAHGVIVSLALIELLGWSFTTYNHLV